MNDKVAVHPSGDLTNGNDSNIGDHKTPHEWINHINSFYTLVENKLQSNSQLKD